MKSKIVKSGQRVQMKSKGSLVPVGALGTIVQVINGATWVYWDDNVGGWGDAEYNIPRGHGWAVGSSDIRKFKGESK